MKKRNIIMLFIILLIIFFISFFNLSDKIIYFSLNGTTRLELNIGEAYTEPGYEAKLCNKYLKIFCSNITDKVDVNKNNIDNKLLISYKINYKNIKKLLTREVTFKDLESPIIKLIDDNINLCPEQKFIDNNYVAYDNIDGDITEKVKTKTLNNKIFYSVKDSSGNKRIIFSNINFIDKEKPTIDLYGGDRIYVYKGKEYAEYGYVASDNCDGDISTYVKTSNNINTSKVGEYSVNYSVSDKSGNVTNISRKVIVYDDISDVQKNGKIVYLTFDDGPGSYTEEILSVLKKYNVKATFFVTNQFSSYQNLIKQEYNEGHSIAVHTYSHNYKKIYSSLENYLTDFNNINQIIYEQTGEYSKIFRFPGGSSNTISKFNRGIMTELTEKMTELGYVYFDWNVDSMDTSEKDPKTIANNVIKELDKNDYSIVLMHDIKKANVESVDMILSFGLENGYTFLPLDISSPIYQHKVNN